MYVCVFVPACACLCVSVCVCACLCVVGGGGGGLDEAAQVIARGASNNGTWIDYSG